MACIFCRIIAGEIASDVVYWDQEAIAIRDIDPQAPKHLLIMPKRHIPYLVDLTDEETSLMGRLVAIANQLAREEGISQSGYRLVINCGPDGTQEVPHLHLHLLGGRALSGKMG